MLSKFNLGEVHHLITKSLIQAGPRLQSLDQNTALQDLSLSTGQVLPKPEEFSNAEIRIYSTDRSIHHFEATGILVCTGGSILLTTLMYV